jgi:hypothetical protein
MLLYYL